MKESQMLVNLQKDTLTKLTMPQDNGSIIINQIQIAKLQMHDLFVLNLYKFTKYYI